MQMFRTKPAAKNTNKNSLAYGIFEVKKYIKRFPISELVIKHEAQRALDSRWVEEIKENWDERVCTPPVVVIDEDKKYVVDGQHRVEAMRQLNYHEVECFLIENIKPSEAFIKINNTKPIDDIDKFIQRAQTEEYEKEVYKLFQDFAVDINYNSPEDTYYADVTYLWEIEDTFDKKAMTAALTVISNIVEYEGKISRKLLASLYEIFLENNNFSKVEEEMMAVKHGLLSKHKSNTRKAIKELQKTYSKSKIEAEIKKIMKVK